MKIHLDRDFMCPYFLFTDKNKSVRFEIGDEIDVYFDLIRYNPEGVSERFISEHSSKYHILNITSKVVVLECYGRCSYVKFEDLEKRINI
jgi:hypothetical protein